MVIITEKHRSLQLELAERLDKVNRAFGRTHYHKGVYGFDVTHSYHFELSGRVWVIEKQNVGMFKDIKLSCPVKDITIRSFTPELLESINNAVERFKETVTREAEELQIKKLKEALA